jgi:hypothetical protein
MGTAEQFSRMLDADCDFRLSHTEPQSDLGVAGAVLGRSEGFGATVPGDSTSYV